MTGGFGWTPKPFDVRIEHRNDGSMLLVPTATLGSYPQRVTDRLEYWAAQTPDQVLVAQRGYDGQWQRVTYAEALQRVRRIAASLAQRMQRRQLSVDRPILILSGNSIEHLLLGLAAMYVGIPYSPVSTAYSQAKADFGKLQHVLQLLTPGMVAVFNGRAFETAISKLVGADVELLSEVGTLAGRSATTLAQLESPADMTALEATHAAVGPDTIAKFLLTSGSTGHPKAVITTQRMMCSNQQMLLQALPFVADEPPILIDWLPWNHVFGGSHNVNLVLFNGGSLYIDEGRPVPGSFDNTLRNIREIAPTLYFNVPKGFEMLALQLQKDPALRQRFFQRLRACLFAGAGLSQHTWDALNAVSMQERGETLPVISGLGATEAAPSVTFTTPGAQTSGVIGLPVAGNIVKLVPVDGKLEVRVKGPNVMPGYWRQPELQAGAFDEEGFYKLGDAAAFVDAADLSKGLRFDGRIAEDFKLSTGTWVSVGPLRAHLLAALAPLVQDVVIAGLNQGYLGILIFPEWTACAAVAQSSDVTAVRHIAATSALRLEIQRRLHAFGKQYPSSSMRVERALLLVEPPSLDKGEITDKGSVNQRAVLRHREALVADLYESTPSPAVISAGQVS